MPILAAEWAQDDARRDALFRAWGRSVAAALNAQLAAAGERFVAEPVCVSRAECAEQIERLGREPGFAAVAVPEPQFVASARFTERLGANVLDARHGRQTAGAVLFVGADNKADSDAALAFAVRAAALVSTGAGVVIVDALPGPPSWATHLHSLTGVYPIARRPRGADTPVLAVHPVVRDGGERYAVGYHSVAPGFPLPTVPLLVRGATHLSVDLEATYLEACQAARTPE